MSTQNVALLRAISEDRALGSAMLFSHRHEYETPDFHVRIMDLWRSADEFVLIEAFREGAKTTLAEEFLTMEAAYGNFAYCVIFGETYAKACQKIEAIAFEARTNVKLAKLFGARILSKKPIENKIWFSSGAMIEGAGWEQEITGFKHLDRRPDRAYLDDVENLERVRSSDAVDATMRKLYQEVLPALDKKRRRVRITETPRAADCMVTRLRSNPDWLCASFPICSGDIDDPATESAWPSRYPMAWVREERDRYARAGMLRQFQQEFLLKVDTAEAKPFTDDMIRTSDLAPASWLPRIAIYDPSRTASVLSSDRTGKVVVSRMGSKIIVHESGGYFWKPDEIRADLFSTQERHRCAAIGIEKNSLDEFLLQPIRFEMLKRGVVLPVRALQAPQDRDKAAFIMGLHPFMVAGDIVLVGGKGAHAQLVAEMLNFPGGRLDILNALAYSLRMFAGDLVYEDFGEANIGQAPDPVLGETVYGAWNSDGNEVLCVAVLRRGRRLYVAGDWVAQGPVTDAVKTVLAEVQGEFPRATHETWVPAELHDGWQRIALVPALRSARLLPFRAEHTAVARGVLAEPIRTTVRDARLLLVDKRATLTLNALAHGYKFPVAQAGRPGAEPERGTSRLAAETLECLAASIGAGQLAQDPDSGANYALNPQGVRYRTALPQRRS
jgi:hypothetical protein